MFRIVFLVGVVAALTTYSFAQKSDRERVSLGEAFATYYSSSFNDEAARDRIEFQIEGMDCRDPIDGVYRCRVRVRMPTGDLMCGKIGVTAMHIFTYRHYEPCRLAFI